MHKLIILLAISSSGIVFADNSPNYKKSFIWKPKAKSIQVKVSEVDFSSNFDYLGETDEAEAVIDEEAE